MLKRNPKWFRNPEDDGINIFLIALTFAAVVLTCLLLYALVGNTLLGDGQPEHVIVPYGGDIPTNTPLPTLALTQPTPTFAPSSTPGPTAPPTERIAASVAQRLAVVNELSGHSNPVSSVAFSPDGRFIASGDLSGVINLWIAGNQALLQTFISPANRVISVAFSPDGSRLAAGGQDALVRLWDLNTGAALEPLVGATGPVNAVAFHPDGSLLAAASDDGQVYLWNMPDGVILGILGGHESYVSSVAFSPQGDIVAAGGEDDTVRLWSIPEGLPLATLLGHTSTVTDVDFSPDGRTLATTSADRSVRLWNVLSESQVALLAGHTGNVNSVAFSPDGSLVVSAAGGIDDDTVRLWDAASGAQIRALDPAGPVNSVAFSPDGLRMATGGATFLTLWGVTQTVQPGALPTPSVSPTMTQGALIDPDAGADACILTARVNEINLRAGPGTSYGIVSQLALNQQAQATGWVTGEEGYTWWRLANGAWARGDVFIDAANPTVPDACLRLPPQETIPPTPAQTAAAPTSAPASGGTQRCQLVARVAEANVRSGPATTYNIIGELALNQTIEATGWARGPEGFTWWQLATGGWARGDVFTDAANPDVPEVCLTLPVATP